MRFIEFVMAQWAKLLRWVYEGMDEDEQKSVKPDMEEALKFTRENDLPESSVEIRSALDDMPRE